MISSQRTSGFANISQKFIDIFCEICVALPERVKSIDQRRALRRHINDLVSKRMLKFLGDDTSAVKIHSGLSEKEQLFLQWICTEKSYKEIAKEMIVSPRTVESWRDQLFEKLGFSTRIGLAMYAIRSGIVKP